MLYFSLMIVSMDEHIQAFYSVKAMIQRRKQEELIVVGIKEGEKSGR